MDVTWFLLGLVVGAIAIYVWLRSAIYVWLRSKFRKMMYQQGNYMDHSGQQGNRQTEFLVPPKTPSYSPTDPNNPGKSQPKAEFETLEKLILNLQETVCSLQAELKELSDSIKAIGPNLEQFNRGQQNASKTPPDSTLKSGTATGVYSKGLNSAVAAYRKMSCDGLRDLPVEPLFVVLDIDSSAHGSAIGETKRHFNQSESKQSAFVIFQEGEKEGWIFPNPRISFTEAMKYVFPELSYENFEEAKDRVEPQRVHSVSQGAWETVTT